MTGVLDQQATCRACVSEVDTGLTAHWPPSQSCTSRQRTAQAVTLGPAGGARALAWGFSLRLAGTGAPHRRNLCPWGPCPARVSSQKSCGLHRASVNHAVVSGTRTRVTHRSHVSLHRGSCVARPPSDTGCFQRQRSSYQGTKGPSALCPPPSAPTSRARGPHVCRCVTSQFTYNHASSNRMC